MNNHLNNPFNKLPAVSILNRKNGQENFYQIIEKLDETKNKNIKNIGNIIYLKLYNNYWTIQDYSTFKKTFFCETEKNFNYMHLSIIKCLNETDEEITKQLNLFSKDCSWYTIQNQEINIMDCYYIINNLIKYINQYIKKYAEKIILETTKEDLENNEMLEKINNNFKKNFEKEFEFITKYPLFEDIYISINQDSLKKLLENINHIIKKNNERQVKSEKWCATPEAREHTNSIRPFRKTLCKNKNS